MSYPVPVWAECIVRGATGAEWYIPVTQRDGAVGEVPCAPANLTAKRQGFQFIRITTNSNWKYLPIPTENSPRSEPGRYQVQVRTGYGAVRFRRNMSLEEAKQYCRDELDGLTSAASATILTMPKPVCVFKNKVITTTEVVCADV